MKELFELRGELSHRTRVTIELSGLIFLLVAWWLVTFLGKIPPSILPSPARVVASFPELHFDNEVVRHALHSIKLNLLGYTEAVAISLPIGFLVGLLPLFRGLFERPVVALRYLPLSAVLGPFILWFGIGSNMKVQFLALGIIVYLLPTVVQRVDEVNQTYVNTVATLGASKWQLVRTVFIPDVLSRVFEDIRILVAISWTYIIIAEVVNRQEGGIGALIFTVARQSRMDEVFACLAVIIFIGVLQDRAFKLFDRKLFPYKYAVKGRGGE
ncbi:MAG: hypothetical protein A3B14_00190 [Candidatus Zambryskibacteria bacterium RIFCSPLOWO2_01_FULL_45_21]|uniref:ABC transmembrane type-1 domain-containing protein n=1 Tax=Candidatus Zambryskibacteria bacterium RIFCSPLOWO2_01_FULL_45_21 TaxID=1802761 RepID=A0A1G2U0Z0_9BACT|nr:MAG: hypothetical protein A3B14_00190 [Candidatus Zambryskibacteria bacterium RIFCSPLOWO2_01_FULL_45_21]